MHPICDVITVMVHPIFDVSADDSVVMSHHITHFLDKRGRFNVLDLYILQHKSYENNRVSCRFEF